MIRDRSFSAYRFLAFPLAVLFVFTLLPTVAGLALSFFQWDGASPPRFVGWTNYRALLSDPRFGPSVMNTLRFVILSVPATVAVGFLLAAAVNAPWFRGKALVRTALFLPTIVSIVAIGFVWRWLLDDHGGLVPAAYTSVARWTDAIGIRPGWLPVVCPSLLKEGQWPMVAVIAVSIWRGVGFCMVLYLAAMTATPASVYEAAEVDGARGLAVVRHITWPLMGPMTAFLLITGVISALQVFDIVFALMANNETPTTRVLNLLVFREFQQSRLGYAAAIGAVIFALTLVATGAQMWLFRRSTKGEPA